VSTGATPALPPAFNSVNLFSSSPLDDAGLTDTSGAVSAPTSLDTGVTVGGSSTSKGLGVLDVLSQVGNFALGAFALSKLPASKIPVPNINTPTPASTGAVALGSKAFDTIIVVGLVVVAIGIIVFVMRRKRG